jgi:predicted DNA-binding protein (MmcQ/YjbR family)
MSVDWIREFCLSLPHATEQVQWGDHLVFKIAGLKMFAIVALHPDGNRMSLKASPERFAELTEIPGVVPAPYAARNFWVALERWDVLRRTEIEDLVREGYALVFAKLPKRTQAELSSKPTAKKAAAKKKTAKKKAAGK